MAEDKPVERMHWWQRLRKSLGKVEGFGWVEALNTWEELPDQEARAEALQRIDEGMGRLLDMLPDDLRRR